LFKALIITANPIANQALEFEYKDVGRRMCGSYGAERKNLSDECGKFLRNFSGQKLKLTATKINCQT
jgi:hypothetical protein